MTTRSKSTPQVHQIKAIFEGYRHTSRPRPQSPEPTQNLQSADTIMMQKGRTEQPLLASELANDIAETTEIVGDTRPRRKLNSKPSWVGPIPHSRSATPHVPAMAQKITIQYQAPKLQPPVFITTSLSDPEWDIIEMTVERQADGSCVFHKSFPAIEGEYQYKFRLGPGDWWVCDEDQPTIDDGAGNRNNILYIRQGESAKNLSLHKKDSVVDREPDAAQPLIAAKGEQPITSQNPGLTTSTEQEAQHIHHVEPTDIESAHAQDEAIPLLKHETSYPGQVEVVPADQMTLSSPSSSATSKASHEDVVWPEADLSDPSLHHFPTHHSGIMKEIQRAEQHSVKDVTSPESPISSPQLVSPLPQLREEETDEILVVLTDEQTSPALESTPSKSKKQSSHHHHSKSAEKDMTEEEKINNKELGRGNGGRSLEMSDIFSGIAFAVVVAGVAVMLYTTGMFGQQDLVKDGGAALGP